MKVALVSFGHSQNALPLAKALSRKMTCDLFLCLAQNLRTQGVLDCTQGDLPPGILSGPAAEPFLGPEIREYIAGAFPTSLIVYNNLKLRNWLNFRVSLQLRQRLRRYDVVHFNGQDGVLPHLIGLLPRKPKVFTIHDVIGHSGERNKKFPERLNHYLLRSRSQVILHNTHDFGNICRQFPTRRSTLNLVPLAPYDIHTMFKPHTNNGEFESDLLFWGRVSEYKGIEYLIAAARMVREELPNLRVILAGSGQYYFDTLPLERDATFMLLNRHISNGELAELIRKTRLVVCPYTDATQSGVVMTTFAFGKPVVATRVGGLAEAVEDGVTGRLVPPRDAPALAAAILTSLRNPYKLQEMEANIRRLTTSEGAGWARVADRTADVYMKATGGRCR